MALRISDCEGPVCWMTPGVVYDNECDFYPSMSVFLRSYYYLFLRLIHLLKQNVLFSIKGGAAPSLSLKVTAQYLGTTILIIETVIPNSSVQPGYINTVIMQLHTYA